MEEVAEIAVGDEKERCKQEPSMQPITNQRDSLSRLRALEACAASIHHASLTCPFISTTLGQQNTTLSFTKISSHLGLNVAKYVLFERSKFNKSGCLNRDQD